MMKSFKYFLSTTLAILFSISAVQAQRLSGYPELVMQHHEQPLYVNFIVLPGNSDSTVTLASVFSFSYRYLPFKRSGSSNGKFTSSTSLSMEVFNSSKEKAGRKNISIEGLEPVARAFWTDTAVAGSYEESKSNEKFLSGHLDVSLDPGVYSFILEMNRPGVAENRISPVQSVILKSYKKIKTGDILVGEKLITGPEVDQIKLSDLGKNILFGQDFYALAYIPQFKKATDYILEINSLEINGSDTSQTAQVYSQKLTNDEIRTEIRPEFAEKNAQGNFISLTPSKSGFAYALLKIPASTFPNNRYQLAIKDAKTEQVVSKGSFQTLWIDMPTSLLSLDVAIDMLRFIVDEQTLDHFSEGSRSDREQKFREFWEQRDPTPKTVFNELMAEYYRRIDYVYENFSSRTLPGYETDQGKIYIKFGAPQNVERKYPPDGATTEIWYYPSRQFIFKATSGFGDFKLVSG
ncbi:MAG TPA: GWxTD domain-containing protein [Balneolaceae bacterium]|nr:GWxTD domain-containing protein [Balneolaceae bacterium]